MTHRLRRRPAALPLAGALLATVAWLGVSPGPFTVAKAVGATTVDGTMESSILAWLNADRAARGLRPLRLDRVLAALADDRAARMAGAGILSHSVAGSDLGGALTARGVSWYVFAEDIGMTTAVWGPEAAGSLYGLWRDSPAHWAQLMSDQLNYVGIGVAYREANGGAYASILLTESSDHTPPAARMVSAQALQTSTGTAARFTWRGSDVLLQTHTAGLRDFDVQYRVDTGTWRLLRDDTTTTSVTLPNRPRGHSYWLRVRARDGRGNISAWSRAMRVVVP